jgi:hypothetical protein
MHEEQYTIENIKLKDIEQKNMQLNNEIKKNNLIKATEHTM